MARSSGGGGGGGGSRSSYSSSSHGSDHWRDHSGGGHSISEAKVRKHDFHGARRYSYRTRRGRKKYIYSDSDLTSCKDAQPTLQILRCFLYIFIALVVAMFLSLKVQKFESTTNDDVKIIDQIGCLSEDEEAKLLETMMQFKSSTGINAQIYTTWLTPKFDIDQFTMDQYYRQYNHENGWLIVYAETQQTPIAWQWEGVQGDRTTKTMDYFLSTFNKTVQNSLENDGDNPDPCKAFNSAFTKSTKMFDAQPDGINMPIFWVWFVFLEIVAILMGQPWKIRFYDFKCKDLEEE